MSFAQEKPTRNGKFSVEEEISPALNVKPVNTDFLKERRLIRVGRQPETSASEASDTSLIRTGTKVEHQRFGTGVVEILEGDKATVNFPQHGKKQLLLKFAKLKIVN